MMYLIHVWYDVTGPQFYEVPPSTHTHTHTHPLHDLKVKVTDLEFFM